MDGMTIWDLKNNYRDSETIALLGNTISVDITNIIRSYSITTRIKDEIVKYCKFHHIKLSIESEQLEFTGHGSMMKEYMPSPIVRYTLSISAEQYNRYPQPLLEFQEFIDEVLADLDDELLYDKLISEYLK